MKPETIHIASFKDTSSVFVWALWHQTGAQYSAGANTSVFSPIPLGKTFFVLVCASSFCMLDSDPG